MLSNLNTAILRLIGAGLISSISTIAVFAAGPGTPAPGFTGLQVQGITPEIAKTIGTNGTKGVLVRDIALGGPAARAGVERSDLIVKFAGVDIDGFESLISVVGTIHAGQNVAVVVIRHGAPLRLVIKASRRPEYRSIVKGSFATIPGVGLTMAAITEKIRKIFGLRWSTVGVVVTIVDKARAKGSDLMRGEVIVKINQSYVWQPSQVAAKYREAKAKGKKSLLLLVEGNTGERNGFHFSLLPVR